VKSDNEICHPTSMSMSELAHPSVKSIAFHIRRECALQLLTERRKR